MLSVIMISVVLLNVLAPRHLADRHWMQNEYGRHYSGLVDKSLLNHFDQMSNSLLVCDQKLWSRIKVLHLIHQNVNLIRLNWLKIDFILNTNYK
jgi:hypothetical protein